MLEFTLDNVLQYVVGKHRPFFYAGRKEGILHYVPKNRKAIRLLMSDKFQTILNNNGLKVSGELTIIQK